MIKVLYHKKQLVSKIIYAVQTKFFSTQMDVDKIIGKSDREVTLMKTVHGIQTKYYTHDEN